jgi:phage gp36-like protein
LTSAATKTKEQNLSAYCQTLDVLGEIQMDDLIALTDDAATGQLNTTVLNQVIANASGEIDRMVGNRYAVPFSPVPPSVQSMAIVITCYRLYRRRAVPDEQNKYFADYDAIRAFLKQVKKGDEQLDLTVTTAFEQVQFSARASVFGWDGHLSNSM